MRKLTLILSFTLFCTLLIGCFNKTKDGKFMREVINLEEFNSEFDDYNSDIRPVYNRSGKANLVFSSKRALKDYYNLVGFHVMVEYDEREGNLGLKKVTKADVSGAFYNLPFELAFITMANGNFNVLGPSFVGINDVSWSSNSPINFLMYADDKSGNLDIKVIYEDLGKTIKGPLPLAFLNSSTANEAYPSLYNDGHSLVFCSDKDEGKYSLYSAELIFNDEIKHATERILNPKETTTKKISSVSSIGYNDKCPYIWQDNLMVFVSDRPGGFGGYDIYYSKRINGVWQSPVNAGARINTEYDEYRPILPNLPNFTYPLMIFSSNRPDGKGGFDLYMTGLEVD